MASIIRTHRISFHRSPTRIDVAGGGPHQDGLSSDGSDPAEPAVDMSRVEPLFQSLLDCLSDQEQQRQQTMQELRLLAVELAIAAASKVVFKELEDDSNVIEAMVSNLLGDLDASQPCIVWLNPNDQQIMERCREAGKIANDQVNFRADPSIPPGDCRIENGKQVLVSNVHAKLTEIRYLLLESLHDAEIERRQPQAKNRGLGRFPDRRASG